MSDKSEPKKKPARGRPKDAGRRRRIVAAARKLFLAEGFSVTSMEAVAAEAGVGKATLYSHFADKEALFEQIMRDTVESQPVAELPEVADAEHFRRALQSYGERLMAILSDPDIHTFHRTILPHHQRLPRLMEVLWTNGPRRMLDDVERLLERGIELGLLRRHDTAVHADHLVSMWKSQRLLMAQEIGLAKAPSKAQQRRHVASSIDLVMAALRRVDAPRGGSSSRRR